MVLVVIEFCCLVKWRRWWQLWRIFSFIKVHLDFSSVYDPREFPHFCFIHRHIHSFLPSWDVNFPSFHRLFHIISRSFSPSPLDLIHWNFVIGSLTFIVNQPMRAEPGRNFSWPNWTYRDRHLSACARSGNYKYSLENIFPLLLFKLYLPRRKLPCPVQPSSFRYYGVRHILLTWFF
jgi:hypothetical protein